MTGDTSPERTQNASVGTPPPENTPTQVGTNRRRDGTVRNQNLVKIQNAARDFEGKVDGLPIMGKQHENIGATYERFAEHLMDYVSINLKRGEDLRILIEDMDEDLEKGISK